MAIRPAVSDGTGPVRRSRVSGQTSAMTRRPESTAEAHLAAEMRWVGIPAPVREHRFTALRRWRFDFAWPEKMVAVEVEGGGFVQGRHTRGKGLENDCEKYNTATILGWAILRVTPDQITSGQAIFWIEQCLR